MVQASYEQLHKIKDFDGLLEYLRDVLDWPIESFDFDEIFFEYEPEELGLDESVADGIESIRQLRSMEGEDTLGIFFVEFKKKKLPMVAMRRLLRSLVIKKRASSQSADRVAFKMRDLLFISQYGEGDGRKISFAQFSDATPGNLPPLKVLAWGETQTKLTLQDVDEKLRRHLKWPDDPTDSEQWHGQMAAAFTLRHGHVIKTSKELATHLAELAKAIYEKAVEALEVETETGPLTKLLRAFQQSLIQDLTPDSFADMYAQTITYGLFSAAVSSYAGDPEYNERREVTTERMVQLVPNTNPFLREMLSTFLSAGGEGNALNFDELGINDVVDLLNDENTDIHSVIREFGAMRRDEDPVIHFYEDFLTAYNSKLRFDRGVFYTPKPVVSYIVRSVHEMLRSEFGLEDGLADTTTWGEMLERHQGDGLELPEGMKTEDAFVQILDPATGTATFLVEVIDVIYETMISKWKDAGKNDAQCNDAWNAYVPQHLLSRVYGYELMMAPYAIAHMKIGVKLTETGYLFASDDRARIFLTNALLKPFHSSEFLVGLAPFLAKEAEEASTTKRMLTPTVQLGNPPYNKETQHLGQEYEYLITNYRSFRGSRIREPGAILFERDINNDYAKFFGYWTLAPLSGIPCVLGVITSNSFLDGKNFRGLRDHLATVYSRLNFLNLHGDRRSSALSREGIEDENVFDIETGVVISLCARTPAESPDIAACEYTDLIGTEREKSGHLSTSQNLRGIPVTLDSRRYFSFLPTTSTSLDEYMAYVPLNAIFELSVDGIKTSRDGLVISSTAKSCCDKIRKFRDSPNDGEVIKNEFKISVKSFDYKSAQGHLKANYSPENALPVSYRPFDSRFIYYDKKIVFSDRRDKMCHMFLGPNVALVCASRLSAIGFDNVLVTDKLVEMKFASHDTNSRVFPLRTFSELSPDTWTCNIAKRFLESLPVQPNESDWNFVLKIGDYILGVLNSGSYRTNYREHIKNDFPRVPVPRCEALFETVSSFGSQIRENDLHEVVPCSDFEVEGVIDGDLTTPKWLSNSVQLSRQCRIKNVPLDLFETTVAGYQVCRTWISAGNKSGIQRKGAKLSVQLVNEYRSVLTRLRNLKLFRQSIDEIIEQHGGWPGAFVTEPTESDQTEDDAPFA
ncbi:type ISP restriction/modification enzyme [Rhodopirellula baltica]